jgi:hypothetical protein
MGSLDVSYRGLANRLKLGTQALRYPARLRKERISALVVRAGREANKALKSMVIAL